MVRVRCEPSLARPDAQTHARTNTPRTQAVGRAVGTFVGLVRALLPLAEVTSDVAQRRDVEGEMLEAAVENLATVLALVFQVWEVCAAVGR